MAIRGQRPKAVALRLVEGSKGAPSLPKDSPIAEGRPVPPTYLKGRALAIWNYVLPILPWLAAPDAFKLADWCEDRAEPPADRRAWNPSRRSEHRKLGSELGFDPTSRARLSGNGASNGKPDEGEDFFDKRA